MPEGGERPEFPAAAGAPELGRERLANICYNAIKPEPPADLPTPAPGLARTRQRPSSSDARQPGEGSARPAPPPPPEPEGGAHAEQQRHAPPHDGPEQPEQGTEGEAEGDGPPITKDAAIKWFNERYAVVREGGDAVVFADGYDNLLHRHVYDRITFDDFRRLFLNRVVKIIKKTDKEESILDINAGEMWLRSPRRCQFINGVTFDPSGTRHEGILN